MRALSTINKLLLLFFSYSAVAKSNDCTKFVDELATFCRYDKNSGVNRLRKIRFLTDKKTLKKECDIFKDIPNTDIEECEEEEEENKNIKMIDFFPDKTDDYNIFNIKSLTKDGKPCEDCTKWILNKDTIDIFPEQSKSKKPFSSLLEMEIQTFENLEKKSYLLVNFAYSNEKVKNGLRILVNGAVKLDLTNKSISSDKTIGYKLKLKPNKSYLVQLEYTYQGDDIEDVELKAAKRQMIDDDDGDSPSDKSFAQIKLLYLKRGDFLKFTGKVKGEPDPDDDDDDDDEEKPSDGVDGEKPTEGADEDKPTEGADEDKPTEGADEDKPTEGADEDKPTEGAGEEKPTEGAGEEKPTEEADEEKPSEEAGEEKPSEGAGEEKPTEEKPDEGEDKEKPSEDLPDFNDPLDYPDPDNNDNIDNGNAEDNINDNNDNTDNNTDNSTDNQSETKEENGSGIGGKVILIGGIGLVASIFYFRSSASSKAKRQYGLTHDNLELDELERGIADIEKDLDYDDEDGDHSNLGSMNNELDADEEAFFEQMSDDDEGYEAYGFK